MTTAYNEGHISTYLDYIHFPTELRLPNVPRDYHFLDTLHKHQISRIPYENLSLHYSTTHTNSLDPAVLFDKFTNRRGGYCMEQTIFYRHMLRALGFHAYTAGARVRLRKNNIPQGDYIGWVHCVNIVTLDDGRRYSCDVGFGGDGPTKPLLISETESQTFNLGPQEVRLHYEALPGSSEPTHKQWIYQYRNSPEQAWNSYYAFPEFEFFDADLSNMNYWTSQSPDSFQRHQTLAVRFLREGTEIVGKVMLAEGLVKRNMGGKTELIQECKTEKERIQALDQYFGIRLTQEQIDGIRGTRTELYAMQSSQSSQNIQSSIGLPLPPRSVSSLNLSGAGDARHASTSAASSGASTPFLRSSSSTLRASGASTPVPPASPRVPYASSPSLSATALHHNNYNASNIRENINRLESFSGIGGAANSVGGSGNASAGAIAASNGESKGGDAWTAACIRTLPLFNGEGQRGYIEDLNDLVTLHVRRSIERHAGNAEVISTLTGEFVDLLAMGMLTLNAKLTGLNDDALLIRITEVWNFFFIGCLPYIEGIFLPLRTDAALKQLLARSGTFASYTTMPNVRSLALQAFRDHLVLPIVDKLAVLFSQVADSHTSQPVEPSSGGVPGQNVSSTARTAAARRLQMVSILASLQTNDERQAATEALAKALQAGLERRPSFAALNETGPNSFAGFYGPGGARGRGMSDAERKAWRRGRQIRPGPIQHRSDDSRREGDVTLDGETFQAASNLAWIRQAEPASYAVH